MTVTRIVFVELKSISYDKLAHLILIKKLENRHVTLTIDYDLLLFHLTVTCD